MLPPLDQIRKLFHYNPLTGGFVYLQQRGPRRAGEPAGSTMRGIPHLFIAGAHYRAAAVAWALFHGLDPSPSHVIPLDGDPLNLRSDNLALSDQPFTRPRPAGRRRAQRPPWQGGIRYSRDEGLWTAEYKRRILGKYASRAEAIAAKRLAIREAEENA